VEVPARAVPLAVYDRVEGQTRMAQKKRRSPATFGSGQTALISITDFSSNAYDATA
jgi:hypothetical protein